MVILIGLRLSQPEHRDAPFQRSKAMSLLSKKQVLAMIPISAATLQRWEDAGIFPKRFHIGGNGAWQKAFWREDAVIEWIDNNTPTTM